MPWKDVQGLWFFVLFVAIFLVVALVQSNRSKRFRERFEMLAREMGWSDVKTSAFLVTTIQGVWNGYNVRIRRLSRQKSVPERIVANMRVQSPARIIITRRRRGLFSGRPSTLFGPPLVDLPGYAEFWIRADEITLVERLMRSSAFGMLNRILESRFDVLRMGADDLLVQRVSADDAEDAVRLAREELELLRMIVSALSLRP